MTQAAEGRLATVYPIESEIRKEDVKFHRRISIIREFASTTSAHGLPNLSRSTNMHNRMFWTISTLAFTGIMVFFVTQSMRAYFSYPTQTSVSFDVQRDQSFPAVSICNISPLRFDNFIGPFLNFTNSRNLTNTNDTTTISKEESAYISLFLQYNMNNNMAISTFFFPLESMLISCAYNRQKCTTSDFIRFFSSSLGNCYTFNAKRKLNHTDVHSTNENGGTGILQLQLYAHGHQYVPYFVPDVSIGMVGMVHDNTELPLIGGAGLIFEPGRKYKVNYRKKTYTLLPSPYSDCSTKISSNMQSMFNKYEDADYAYSQVVCYMLCKQAYVYNQCGCISPTFWSARFITLPGTNQTIEAPLCNTSDPCYPSAMTRISTTDSIWNQYCSDCVEACSSSAFIATISEVSAPPITQMNSIKTFVENSNITLPVNWSTNWQTEIQKNYIAIDFVCETTVVENYVEVASISPTDLISNIGGQSGLWIGISFLSIMELIEMLYRLIRYHYYILRQRIQKRPEES